VGALAAEVMSVAAPAAAPQAAMVDVAFAVQGDTLPREYRRALARTLLGALPWLAEQSPPAAVHRLNLSSGGEASRALLSRRTRLMLRVPRERAHDAARLAGRQLCVEGHALRLGDAHVRELLPWGTLYAHFVAGAEDDDEAAFLRRIESELAALGVRCRTICGRAQGTDAGRLRGFSVMLDGLSAADALRMQERGLGAHRELGCGVFVPHKSASAVGAPD
jgi:CRISPR-associated protein Cas6